MVSIEAASFEVADYLAGPKGPMIEIKDRALVVPLRSLAVKVCCVPGPQGVMDTYSCKITYGQ